MPYDPDSSRWRCSFIGEAVRDSRIEDNTVSLVQNVVLIAQLNNEFAFQNKPKLSSGMV